MAYISILLRTALVLFSTLGWVHAVSKRLPVALSIPTVLCSIGSAMFFAGILNIMEETAILILVCGLYLAVRALRRHESAARLLCPGTIFLGLCAVVYFFLLYGREFVDHDSFSNWATVEKVMLQKNRFPNFLDTQIGFESYPPRQCRVHLLLCSPHRSAHRVGANVRTGHAVGRHRSFAFCLC